MKKFLVQRFQCANYHHSVLLRTNATWKTLVHENRTIKLFNFEETKKECDEELPVRETNPGPQSPLAADAPKAPPPLSPEQAQQAYVEYFLQAEDLFHEKKRLFDAGKLYAQCISLFPERPHAYGQRAKIYLAKGEFQLAQTDLQQAIRCGSKDAEVFYNMALLTVNTRPQEAQEALRLFQGAMELAVENGSASDSTNYLVPLCLNNCGYLYLEFENDPKHAVELLSRAEQQVLEKQQQQKQQAPVQLAQIFYNRGRAHTKLGEYALAVTDFNSFMEIKPLHYTAHVHLAKCYEQMEYNDKVVQTVDHIIQAFRTRPEFAVTDKVIKKLRNQQYYELFTLRCAAHVRLGEYQKALEDGQLMIDNNLSDEEPYKLRGLVHFSFSNFEKAIQDFSYAIQRNGSMELYWLRSQAWEALGRPEDAVADMEYVIELTEQSQTTAEHKMHKEQLETMIQMKKAAMLNRGSSPDTKAQGSVGLNSAMDNMLEEMDLDSMHEELKQLESKEPMKNDKPLQIRILAFLVRTAKLQLRAGRATHAQLLLAKALGIDPNCLAALHLRAHIVTVSLQEQQQAHNKSGGTSGNFVDDSHLSKLALQDYKRVLEAIDMANGSKEMLFVLKMHALLNCGVLQFKLTNYPDAIGYFSTMINEISTGDTQLDPQMSEWRELAIQYKGAAHAKEKHWLKWLQNCFAR